MGLKAQSWKCGQTWSQGCNHRGENFKYLNPILKGGSFCPTLQRSQLTYSRGYVPVKVLDLISKREDYSDPRYFSVELKFQHTKNEKISLVYMFSDNLFLHWSPDFVVKICSSILQDCIFQICTSKCLTWKVKEKWSVNNYFLDSFFYILKKKFKKETH